MTVLLAILIVYVPNQLHFPEQLGLPGLNVFNLMLLMAFGALAFMRRETGLGQAAEKPALTTALFWFYAILGLSVLIAIARGSHHLIQDVTIYKTVLSYSMLYFIAYYGVRDMRTLKRLLALVLLVFLVASIEAIREGMQYGFGSFAHSRRAGGPFSQGGGNANYAGVFYSIFSAFTLALVLFGRTLKPWQRLLGLAFYVAGAVAIFATFSRQSFLILAVTTLLLAARRHLLLALTAVLVIANYALWAPEGVIDRVQMTEQQNAYGQEVLEDSAESRYVLWAGARDIIRNHPTGIGFNQFKDAIDPYMPSWITARDAQNEYLLIAAEAGIQGLLAFLFVLWCMFRLGFHVMSLPANREAQALGIGYTIAVTAVVMGNIYSSTFFSGEVMGNFWILSGLVSRYLVLARAPAAIPVTVGQTLTPLARMRRTYARWQRPSPLGESETGA